MHLKISKLNRLFKGFNFGSGYVKLMLLLAAILLLDLFFGPEIKYFSVILVFIVLGSASTFYYRFFDGPLSFELVKLATVLSAVAYGTVVGLLVGLISTIFGRMLSGSVNHRSIASMAGIALIAVFSGIFRDAVLSGSIDIAFFGIILVVVYQIVVRTLSMVMGDTVIFAIINAGTNIIFNVILFSKLAPYLLPIIMSA